MDKNDLRLLSVPARLSIQAAEKARSGYNDARMEIYLVRHGQSEYNAGLTAHLDSGLTPTGRAQAARTAARLADEGLTHAYASPLRRTLQTIGPICAASHLRAEVYAEVCEYFCADNDAYKTFQGLSPQQISEQYPFAFVSASFPCTLVWWQQQLETNAMLSARAERARDTLLRRHAATDQRVLVVSHADTVGRLMEAFLRVSPYPDNPPWVDNCGVTRLHCPPDISQPATLIYANDTQHLAGLPE